MGKLNWFLMQTFETARGRFMWEIMTMRHGETSARWARFDNWNLARRLMAKLADRHNVPESDRAGMYVGAIILAGGR